MLVTPLLLKRPAARAASIWDKALSESIDRLEYEYGILKDIEDYRAGRLKTCSLDEVSEMLGLDD